MGSIKYHQFINNPTVRFILFLIATIVLSVVTINSFYPNTLLIEGYDTPFHLSRLKSLSNAIHGSSFYVSPEYLNEYGYAMNTFYPNLTLIPFAWLVKPFGLIAAHKVSLYCSLILGVLIAFVSIKKVHKNTNTAIIFSWIYTFALYKLLTMSLRGSWPEMFALLFVPIVYWGMHEIMYGNYKKDWYILGVGFALLIHTHLLASLMVFHALCIFLIIYCKYVIKEPKRILFLVYAGGLALLLSLCFIAPMLEQMLNDSYHYKTHPYIPNMLDKLVPLRWVMWGLFSGLTDAASRLPSIGLLITLPLFARIFIKEKTKAIKFADISTICGFIFLIAATDVFPWKFVPHSTLNVMQFPWRLVFLSTFLLALSGSIYISSLLVNSRQKPYALYTVITILVLIYIKSVGGVFSGDETLIKSSNEEYIAKNHYGVGGGEYIPSAVPSVEYPTERGKGKIQLIGKEATVSEFEQKNNSYSFNITAVDSEKRDFILPLIYYKGYKATLNGVEISMKQSKDGLLEITSTESGNVEVWYAGTWIQRSSVYISLLSLIGLIGYLIYTKKSKMKQKPSILV